DNLFDSLDLSGCPVLTILHCSGNLLTSLDLSGCGELWSLDCSDNLLSSLDLTDCVNLEHLSCGGNEIDTFDFSSNTSLEYADFGEGYEYPINEKYFPDPAFMEYVSSEIDTNGNGFLSKSEMYAVTEINVSGLGIETLAGIECFTSLEILDCSDNSLTGELDLTEFMKLDSLSCENNEITLICLNYRLYSEGMTHFSYDEGVDIAYIELDVASSSGDDLISEN
ncbi:MAG: hypothetical protein LUH43_05460, partial [Clostridia bacterium]|nr:hypothetical protein [Clostridia bacterium]